MFSGRMRDERNFRMLVDCLFLKVFMEVVGLYIE